MRRSVDLWYFRISRSATVPGLNLRRFLSSPVVGALLREIRVASCLRDFFPPVLLRAAASFSALVRAMVLGLICAIALEAGAVVFGMRASLLGSADY